jgi:hypothetical protein
LVVRSPTPAPTLAKPDDSSHNEPESQTDVENTGTECGPAPGTSDSPELSSVEKPNDVVYVASPPGSSQSTADVDIGASALYWPFPTLT